MLSSTSFVENLLGLTSTNMQLLIYFFLLCMSQVSVLSLENLIGSDIEKCLKCICYATTSCNDLNKCVELAIPQKYWEDSGSPTVNIREIPSPRSYRSCMRNTNCLWNTMKVYTSAGGANRDTNCDGEFDCKDRLAIHFRGGRTENYTLERYRVIRFDYCAVMNKLPVKEGWSPCDLEAINNVFPTSFRNKTK